MMLSPRLEEFLSWLQGRAPVGSPVFVMTKEIMVDLGYVNREVIWRNYMKLVRKGYLEVISRGNARWPTRVKVIRRLEWESNHRSAIHTGEERAAVHSSQRSIPPSLSMEERAL